MGRAPCCDKANVKKGPWSPEEDATLKAYIEANGTGGNWIALPQKIGLKRCGKSCRLRWLNYLRPNIKHGGFSEEEDHIICSLYITIGSRWSIIAAQLPGRTDNDIKNYWNTRLKKKLLGKQRKQQQAAARRSAAASRQEHHDQMMMKRSEITDDQNYNNPGGMQVSQLTQTPYWPQLPCVTSQDPVMNFRYPIDVSFVNHQEQQLYDENNSQLNMLPISASSSNISPINNSSSTSNTNCTNNMMFEGGSDHDGFPLSADHLISELMMYGNINNNQHILLDQGLDIGTYYASTDNINMVDGTGSRTTTGSGTSSSVESSSWGSDINSLGATAAYPHIISSAGYEASQQSMPQVSIFDESSYFGPH